MLEKRLNKISPGTFGVSGKRRSGKVTDIRERHTKLMEIEGWYQTDRIVPEWCQSYYQEYLKDKSTLKFTRWLNRHTHFDGEALSRLGKELKIVDFKLSCRHNDLTRLGDTPHYKTCMTGQQNWQQVHYLADPDIAVLYVKDVAGKYMWRALIRLVQDKDSSFALVCYRPYGNGPTLNILKTLSEKTGLLIYFADDTPLKNDFVSPGAKIRKLTSPTSKGNIPLLRKAYWSDHDLAESKKGKTQIYVVADPVV